MVMSMFIGIFIGMFMGNLVWSRLSSLLLLLLGRLQRVLTLFLRRSISSLLVNLRGGRLFLRPSGCGGLGGFGCGLQGNIDDQGLLRLIIQ